MITKEQAMTANEFHVNGCSLTIGPRGGVLTRIIRVRRTGRTKTWKTRPNEFRVPVKYGLYNGNCINHFNAFRYHTVEDCPLNKYIAPENNDKEAPK